MFRETRRDGTPGVAPVTLAVWFRLRAIPPRAAVRRWLFERGCIVNTLLLAGFDGYLVKLWMVNPSTSEYAGLYSWATVAGAQRYGRYITAILRPWSAVGSVGYEILPAPTLDEFLARRHDRVPPAP